MPVQNTAASWGLVARWLHWLMALGLLLAAGIAWWSEDLESTRARYEWMVRHKSIGLLLLALLLIRLGWRLGNPVPALPPAMPGWERWLARIGHGLIYLLLFWMPLTGWLAHSASGLPLRWFGWFRVPGLVEKSESLKHSAEQWHEIGVWVLAAVLLLHVAAALKHHWINRDDVLRRMWSGRVGRGS